MWAEGREGTDLSQGTQMGARAEQQLFPTPGQPFGSPWLCVKASEATPRLPPTSNAANCAVKTSCTRPTPLCPLPKHSPGQFQLTQRIPSPPSPAAQPFSLPCLHPFSAGAGTAPAGSHGTQGPISPISLSLAQGKPHPDLFQLQLALPNRAGFGQDVPGPAASSQGL